MAALIDTQIRQRLLRQVAGEITLEQFVAWFAPVVWRIDSASPAARDLAYEIELRLAEYSNGDWTEGELKRLFRSLVVTQVVVSNPQPYVVHNQTTSLTVTAGATTSLSPFVGTTRAVVSA